MPWRANATQTVNSATFEGWGPAPKATRLHNTPCAQGHRGAVIEVHWFQDGETLLSCSADKTVRAWDADTGRQVKKLSEHTSYVNSCCPLKRGPKLFVSGSDDKTVKVGCVGWVR